MAETTAALDSTAPYTARLMVSYKLLFMMVRAYQDPVYCHLVSALGSPADSGSMSSVLKEGTGKRASPLVRGFLLETCPEYVDWFGRWTSMRDRVKAGLNFSLSGPDEDLGVSPQHTSEEGVSTSDASGKSAVRISHVVEALSMSARVATLVEGQLVRRG
jgi:hypothetical protein